MRKCSLVPVASAPAPNSPANLPRYRSTSEEVRSCKRFLPATLRREVDVDRSAHPRLQLGRKFHPCRNFVLVGDGPPHALQRLGIRAIPIQSIDGLHRRNGVIRFFFRAHSACGTASFVIIILHPLTAIISDVQRRSPDQTSSSANRCYIPPAIQTPDKQPRRYGSCVTVKGAAMPSIR